MKITYADSILVTEVNDEGLVIGQAPDGNYGQRVLGFSITRVPSVEDYPESYRKPLYYHFEDVTDELLEGYYAQFVDAGGQMYGWGDPIRAVVTEPDTFGNISDERQWEWDSEIEVMRNFIEEKGLSDELVVFARKAADDQHAEDLKDGTGDRRVFP